MKIFFFFKNQNDMNHKIQDNKKSKIQERRKHYKKLTMNWKILNICKTCKT